MITDDSYLIKLKSLKWSDERIAVRMKWTVEQVQKRWLELLQISESMQSNGYVDLNTTMTQLGHQFQLVGQSLVEMSRAMSNSYTPAELKELLYSQFADDSHLDALVSDLFKNCIILKPYIPTPPEKQLEETERPQDN